MSRIYDNVLGVIQKWMGKGTTYSSELLNAGRDMFSDKFKGVFPFDKIPKTKKGYMIINLDDSDEPGSHWIAKADNMLYDSFGRDFSKYVKGAKKSSDKDSEQSVVESNCGQRCLAWLYIFDKFGPKAALSI